MRRRLLKASTLFVKTETAYEKGHIEMKHATGTILDD
jgi:hypothetical protein